MVRGYFFHLMRRFILLALFIFLMHSYSRMSRGFEIPIVKQVEQVLDGLDRISRALDR